MQVSAHEYWTTCPCSGNILVNESHCFKECSHEGRNDGRVGNWDRDVKDPATRGCLTQASARDGNERAPSVVLANRQAPASCSPGLSGCRMLTEKEGVQGNRGRVGGERCCLIKVRTFPFPMQESSL